MDTFVNNVNLHMSEPYVTLKTRDQEPVRLSLPLLGPLYTRTCLDKNLDKNLFKQVLIV